MKNFIIFCHTHKIAKMFNITFLLIHLVQAESHITRNFFLTCMLFLLIFRLNAYIYIYTIYIYIYMYIYIYIYIICTYIYISHVFYVLLASRKFIAIGYEKFFLATLLLTISIRFSKEKFFASVAIYLRH